MSGLIRREDIPYVDLNSDMPHSNVRVFVAFKEQIDVLPSADAVEVVRCKDCRHRDLFSCPLAENDFQKDDDFCSWGERKE